MDPDYRGNGLPDFWKEVAFQRSKRKLLEVSRATIRFVAVNAPQFMRETRVPPLERQK